MRLSKYFVSLTLITLLGLLYAHQQFLLTKVNYIIIESNKEFTHLLDRNKKLMYNVTALESPASLEAKLMNIGADYDVPVRWAVVKRSKSEPTYRIAKVAKRRNAVIEGIMNFLAVKAEAQAVKH